MKHIHTKAKREWFMLVEYEDGTFRVYSDELAALRAYSPKKDESVRIVSRIKPPCKETN